MNKCINGKIIKMTGTDIIKRESRINQRAKLQEKPATAYELRIKELENIVSELLSQREKEKTAEVVEKESVAAEEV